VAPLGRQDPDKALHLMSSLTKPQAVKQGILDFQMPPISAD